VCSDSDSSSFFTSTERLRTTLGHTTLGKDCIAILKYSNKCKHDSTELHEAQIELLRTMANLCIDHDENRTDLLENEGPQEIIHLLQNILGAPQKKFNIILINLLRISAGALLNMQLDHLGTRLALRQDKDTIETLLQLATDSRIYYVGEWYSLVGTQGQASKKKILTGASISSWTWRIIQDLCSNESKEEGEDQEDVGKESPRGKKKIGAVDEEEGDKAIESILAIGASRLAHFLIIPLRSFVSKEKPISLSKEPWQPDDVSDLMESDMDIIQIVTELIEACAIDSKPFRLSSLETRTDTPRKGTILDFLMKYLDYASPPPAWSVEREEGMDQDLPPKPSDEESAVDIQRVFERSKSAIAKAIVIIAGEDENMGHLFEAKENWFMVTLKDWMSRDAKERDDLVSTAMLAMGNLARKGELDAVSTRGVENRSLRLI
jgi:hypothetical protein